MNIKKKNFALIILLTIAATLIFACGIFAAVAKSINFNLTMYLNPTIYFALDLQIDENGDGEFTTTGEQKIYRIFDNTAANGDHVGWAIVNMNKIILQNTDAVDNPFGDLGINACFKITVTNLTDAAAQGISENDEEFQHLWLTLKPTEFSNMYAVPDYGVQNVGVGEEKAKSFIIYPQTISTDYFEIPFTVELKQKTYDHNIILNIADDACPVNNNVEIKWQTPQNTVTNGHNFTNRMISDYDAIPIESVQINGVDVVYSYNSETLEFSISGTNLTAQNNENLIITINKVGYKLVSGRNINVIMNGGTQASDAAPNTTITSVTYDFDQEKYLTIKNSATVNKVVNQNANIDVIHLYIQNNQVYILSDYNIFTNQTPSIMFYDFQVIQSIAFNNFDTSLATDMNRMFYNCFRLENLDLLGFNTENNISFNHFFVNCKLITNFNLSTFDTSNVIDMSNMFHGCTGITSLDLSNFNTSKVTNMASMFHYCTGLGTNGGTLNLSGWNTSKVTSMLYMFYNCTGLTSLDLSSFDTSNVTNMSSMFQGCTGLTSLDLSNFNTSNVTDMSYMFQGCTGLTSLDLSNLDTSNVTNMTCMFQSCYSLTSLDVSTFDTCNVTSMYDMFGYCYVLETLNLMSFNTSNVATMRGMFIRCNTLTILNLYNFNTENVTSMYHMFAACTALKTIYVTDRFTTESVVDSVCMFDGCTQLKGGNGTAYSSSYPDKTYARIDEGNVKGYFTRI